MILYLIVLSACLFYLSIALAEPQRWDQLGNEDEAERTKQRARQIWVNRQKKSKGKKQCTVITKTKDKKSQGGKHGDT